MPEGVDPKAVAQWIIKYQAQEDNIIKYQLETNKDLLEFKHDLLGQTSIDGGKTWVKDESKIQLCNEKGANAILTYMKLHVSRHVSLSHFRDADEVSMYSFYDIKSFIYFLVQHKEEFGFESYSAISLTLATIDKLNISTMYKALHGWEGDGLRKQYTHVESDERVTQMDNKPKLFGGMFAKGV